ncbi:sigma 54-interacting transcriptional regulator [Spirosoma pulveris]
MHTSSIAGQSSLEPYTILIVEDEYIIANDLQLILEQNGYVVLGIATSMRKAIDMISQHQPKLVLLDIYLKGRETGIDLAHQLEELGIPFIYISANDNPGVLEAVKATQPSGYIVKPFREQDILTAISISRYKQAHSVEVKLREEKLLQIDLSEALSLSESWTDRLTKIAQLFQPYIPFDFLTVRYQQRGRSSSFHYYRVGYQEFNVLTLEDILQLPSDKRTGEIQDQITFFPEQFSRFNFESFDELNRKDPFVQILAKSFRLAGAMVAPFQLSNGDRFLLCFLSRNQDAFKVTHQALLERLEQPLVLTLERVLAYEEVARLSEKLKQENSYLQQEVQKFTEFEEIIGSSEPLQNVFRLVSQVAHIDTTVLLLGESGTGKELIARAVHQSSSRKGKLLIKVNCAALPANLIESELFGHEKGSFTGAFEKRIGKFELAQGGTLLLDEIGELPLELQAKLLRVLQEKEIDRIGGKTPIKTDVRVIAATNRNLEDEVRAGRFRLDLYYRLSTYPIIIPPLRDRLTDLPLLATYFARKMAQKQGKPFLGFADNVMPSLLKYNWPGNIRELENVIEQAVILNSGQSPVELGRSLGKSLMGEPHSYYQPTNQPMAIPQSSRTESLPVDFESMLKSQQEVERNYILTVLQQTNGRIRGSGGAAELLNLKPTTLEYRMEKMGIRKVLIMNPPPTD